jgi:hypothetical protein
MAWSSPCILEEHLLVLLGIARFHTGLLIKGSSSEGDTFPN